jgi:hypothetical protein
LGQGGTSHGENWEIVLITIFLFLFFYFLCVLNVGHLFSWTRSNLDEKGLIKRAFPKIKIK